MRASAVAALAPRLVMYVLERSLGFPGSRPLSLTLSVTQRCNSRCKTCNIWQDKRPKDAELSLEEYQKILQSLGRSVIWYTLSGGEPFLRDDIVEIVGLIKRYSDPKVVIIPTNGFLTNRIEEHTRRILEKLSPGTELIVNLSLDGIGEEHDAIRGLPGSFGRVTHTLATLKELKKEYPHSLSIGMHTVVSKYNVSRLLDLFRFVREELRPDSYICEIAENREELLNMDCDIAPSLGEYKKAIRELQRQLRSAVVGLKGLALLVQAFRLKYYDYVVAELERKRRLIHCYAGIVSAQISPWGDVWPCCILAHKAEMGNLRDFDLNFLALWRSKAAIQVRDYIQTGGCYCPMANVHYTNMLLSPEALVGIARNLLAARLSRWR